MALSKVGQNNKSCARVTDKGCGLRGRSLSALQVIYLATTGNADARAPALAFVQKVLLL